VAKEAFEEKIAAIEALRKDPLEALEPLRKALRDRNNFACSKAAAVAGDLLLRDLIPDLLAAFERFLKDPVKTDPKCWAKNAIIKALKDLDYQDPAVYLRGLAHVQMEPVWGGSADAAIALRGACALALVACSLPRDQILIHLADTLADPELRVRVDAARAIAQLPGQDSILMLRVKAQAGDKEPAVVGQCFLSLLGIDPRPSIPFVAKFLTASNEDLRFEAAAALGECPELLAVETLIARWRAEKKAEMRRAIILSLGVSRVPEAKQFLDQLTADEKT
jgi:HEAT repeat protein